MTDKKLSASKSAHITDRNPNRDTNQKRLEQSPPLAPASSSGRYGATAPNLESAKKDKYYCFDDTQSSLEEDQGLLNMLPRPTNGDLISKIHLHIEKKRTIILDAIITHRR